MLLAVILLALGASALRAQDEAEGSRREIYTVLAYGDDLFEPELWLAQATEHEDRTTGSWVSADLGGLAYADYLHFPSGIEDPEAFFDEAWFEVTFENYDFWALIDRCEFEDGTTLRLFDVKDDGNEYWMRYWTRQETETRVLAFFLVFPKTSGANLEKYSERFAPETTSCLED